MKDIKSLYLAAKTSGKQPDIDAYTECIAEFLENKPYDYISNLEYIISSSIGLKTLREFVETYGISVANYKEIVERIEYGLEKCEKLGKDSSVFKEALSYIEGFRDQYPNIFNMYEYFEENVTDEYIKHFYERKNPLINSVDKLYSSMGNIVIPDIMIESIENGNINKLLSIFERSNMDPTFYQWIVECIEDVTEMGVRADNHMMCSRCNRRGPLRVPGYVCKNGCEIPTREYTESVKGKISLYSTAVKKAFNILKSMSVEEKIKFIKMSKEEKEKFFKNKMNPFNGISEETLKYIAQAMHDKIKNTKGKSFEELFGKKGDYDKLQEMKESDDLTDALSNLNDARDIALRTREAYGKKSVELRKAEKTVRDAKRIYDKTNREIKDSLKSDEPEEDDVEIDVQMEDEVEPGPTSHYDTQQEQEFDNTLDNIKERSLSGITERVQLRAKEVFRESVLTGNDELKVEYSAEELNTIKNFITFKEYKLCCLDNENDIMDLQSEIYNLYEQFGDLLEESDEAEVFDEASRDPKVDAIKRILSNMRSVARDINKVIRKGMKKKFNEHNEGLPFLKKAAFPSVSVDLDVFLDGKKKILKRIDDLDSNSDPFFGGVSILIKVSVPKTMTTSKINESFELVRKFSKELLSDMIDNKDITFDSKEGYEKSQLGIPVWVSKKLLLKNVDTDLVFESVEDMEESIVEAYIIEGRILDWIKELIEKILSFLTGRSTFPYIKTVDHITMEDIHKIINDKLGKSSIEKVFVFDTSLPSIQKQFARTFENGMLDPKEKYLILSDINDKEKIKNVVAMKYQKLDAEVVKMIGLGGSFTVERNETKSVDDIVKERFEEFFEATDTWFSPIHKEIRKAVSGMRKVVKKERKKDGKLSKYHKSNFYVPINAQIMNILVGPMINSTTSDTLYGKIEDGQVVCLVGYSRSNKLTMEEVDEAINSLKKLLNDLLPAKSVFKIFKVNPGKYPQKGLAVVPSSSKIKESSDLILEYHGDVISIDDYDESSAALAQDNLFPSTQGISSLGKQSQPGYGIENNKSSEVQPYIKRNNVMADYGEVETNPIKSGGDSSSDTEAPSSMSIDDFKRPDSAPEVDVPGITDTEIKTVLQDDLKRAELSGNPEEKKQAIQNIYYHNYVINNNKDGVINTTNDLSTNKTGNSNIKEAKAWELNPLKKPEVFREVPSSLKDVEIFNEGVYLENDDVETTKPPDINEDFGKPSKGPNVLQHAFQDMDRKLIKTQQAVKKGVQQTQNTGRAFFKPIARTQQWVGNMAEQWRNKSSDKIKEDIANPHARSKLWKAIKSAILVGSLWKAKLLFSPLFIFLAITKRQKKNRLRREIIGEIRAELEIIEQKIEDARAAGDRKAVYQLMRFRNELRKQSVRVGGSFSNPRGDDWFDIPSQRKISNMI